MAAFLWQSDPFRDHDIRGSSKAVAPKNRIVVTG